MSELLPCPFCGGECETKCVGSAFGRSYIVKCLVCNMTSEFYDTEAEAIYAWNARPDPAQTTIANAVRERGYWDGWTPEQMVARQFVKLVEEVDELDVNVIYPCGHRDYDDLSTMLSGAGILARRKFDNKAEWDGKGGVGNIDAIKSEMSDCMVVLMTMAAAVEAMTGEPFDLVQAAVEKATKDIERGVR